MLKTIPKIVQTIRIKPEILAKAKKQAEKTGHTLSYTLSDIIEKHFKKSKA